ncbi:MAG: hypothetical protein ACI84C_001570 [Flavobacteriales bacterium]|jgi:hypothetical protein
MINEADHERWVSSLSDVGMNTVSTTVYARQGIWNSDNIWWNEEEVAVESEIRTAKAKGLKVVLILRVLLDHYFEENKFLWHGMIMPENDSLLGLWFDHYSIFVEKWAVKAEEMGVDALCIGSELRELSSTLEVDGLPPLLEYYFNEEKQREFIDKNIQYEERLRANDLWVRGYGNYDDLEVFLADKSAKNKLWAESVGRGKDNGSLSEINRTAEIKDSSWREIIADARERFSGRISYAANFDNYEHVGFWDALDFIGVNAYFPLREIGEALEPQILCDRWSDHMSSMSDFQKTIIGHSLPVIFTELGYINKEGCSLAPWEGFGYSILSKDKVDSLIVWGRQDVDLNERAMALSALHEACQKDSSFHLQGILYWKLTSETRLLQYEPFGLSINSDQNDPLLEALQLFSE